MSEHFNELVKHLAPIFGAQVAQHLASCIDGMIDERLLAHQQAIDELLERLPKPDVIETPVPLHPAPAPAGLAT